MKKVLSFVVENTYNNARKIADYIVITLMKYPNPSIGAITYASSVKRTVYDTIFGVDIYNDDTILSYKITIYKISGNRGSILSPSQNEMFNSIITVDDLNGILDKMNKSE